MSKKKVVVPVYGVVQVIVDPEVKQELDRRRLHIGPNFSAQRESEYPWVLGPQNLPIEPLHVFVRRFLFGEEGLPKEGEVIHHKNGHKTDNRNSNLEVISRGQHVKTHNAARQRFTVRKRNKLGDLYRPHAPAPVKTLAGAERADYEQKLLARRERELHERREKEAWFQDALPARNQPLDRAAIEEKLTEVYHRLHPRARKWDSGKKIPPPLSRPRQGDRLLADQENRKLPSITRIRRGCTYGEVGLVYALVDDGFDIDAVAREVKLPKAIIEKMKKEPAVALAVENWHHYRRLPKPNTFSKLGRLAPTLSKKIA